MNANIENLTTPPRLFCASSGCNLAKMLANQAPGDSNPNTGAQLNRTPTITITAPTDPVDDPITDQLPPTPAGIKPTSKKSMRKSSFAAGKNFLIQRRKTIHDIINLDIFNSLIGDAKSKQNNSSYFLNKSNIKSILLF